MTTTRFISPSLPRRVLSRLSYLPYTKGFPRIFLSPIFSPGYHLCSGIIFTYICLYLFFFSYLALSVVSFFQIRRINLFIYLFSFLSLFLFFFSYEFHSNLFKFRFRSRRSRIRASIRYLFLLRFYPFFFFLSFFLQRNSILDP